MAFDLTQCAFDSIRDDDIPELTTAQLAEMRPLYNAEERAILQGHPTEEQLSEILHTALTRLKQESKQ